jgi:prepilin-type N-terminal cleavage/methylation domain-containing protein
MKKPMQQPDSSQKTQNGFSLLELLIAMVVTVTIMGLAGTLLAGSFHIRDRENDRSAALAATQRALNVVARDIANAGTGLKRNGIVAEDSDASSIRIRANLNAFSGQPSSATLADPNEDVIYFLHVLNAETGSGSLMRYDVNTQQSAVLVSNLDGFEIYYFNQKVDYTLDPAGGIIVTTPGVTELDDQSLTTYIVITALITLPPSGQPNTPGYQPAARVQLASDIALRNRNLAMF